MHRSNTLNIAMLMLQILETSSAEKADKSCDRCLVFYHKLSWAQWTMTLIVKHDNLLEEVPRPSSRCLWYSPSLYENRYCPHEDHVTCTVTATFTPCWTIYIQRAPPPDLTYRFIMHLFEHLLQHIRRHLHPSEITQPLMTHLWFILHMKDWRNNNGRNSSWGKQLETSRLGLKNPGGDFIQVGFDLPLLDSINFWTWPKQV